MCRISSKIKLCTCSASSTTKLKHYWTFYRFNKGKREVIIGDVIMPYGLIDRETEVFNESLLLHRLKELDAFDIDLAPKKKDRLLISIKVGGGPSDYRYYGFELQRSGWVSCPYEFFEWNWEHDEVLFGKLQSALTPSKSG